MQKSLKVPELPESYILRRVSRAYRVCKRCGYLHGRNPEGKEDSTWVDNRCEVCGRRKEVTEFKDFGFGKYTS